MKGRRLVFEREDIPVDVEGDLRPGDYGYLPKIDRWLCRAPNGDEGCLSPRIHKIIEHEDGSITVSPSIQFNSGERWHGYLEHGIWRKV